jgi:ubiquitin carboxyl-terminal hydrolase L3
MTNKAKAHFVCYVEQDGHVFELDGRRSIPINKGKIDGQNLGEKASKLIKHYMELDSWETQLSVMALAPNVGDAQGGFF